MLNHGEGYNEYKESVFPIAKRRGEVHDNGQERICGTCKRSDSQD